MNAEWSNLHYSRQYPFCSAGGETDAKEAQEQTNREETGKISMQIYFIKAFLTSDAEDFTIYS